MGLASGTRLGPYEIQSPLGAGGMGEVYRARDMRLERDVAIKVLPANLSADSFLRQRLEREAKAISKLSHPHICTLHDIGHQEGIDFLVMELVDGETLEQRLTKGALPPEQAIRCGAQIAEALAKAHKSGIVHRDLKPANVMLTKSGAKLMDFGLAKSSGAAPLAEALTQLTEERSKLTAEGIILGTIRYMAPEQLEGKEVDARTDIFALGEVVYEMVTGRAPFMGKSQASVIAAILTAEPQPISALQPVTPAGLQRVVKKCLAKEPDDRWQSASDLAGEFYWMLEAEPGGTKDVPMRRGTSRLAWSVAASLLLSLAIVGAMLWQSRSQGLRAMYFNAAVPFAANDLALSPDGHMMVMVAYSAQTNNYVLWTQEVGSNQTTLLDGTQGATYPFWSPDGKSIGFFAAGKLKKVDASGRQGQVICDAPNGRGGAWNRDGVIIFAPAGFGGMSRVSSQGGQPVELTKPDTSRFESSHRWPVFLPDGKHFLYLAANFSGQLEHNAIFLGSLDSQEKSAIVSTNANAAYAEPGYLLYLRDKTLVAQPFDPKKFALSGEARSLSDKVLYFPGVDKAVFSVSKGEVLAAQTGTGASVAQLTWFDRSGKALGVAGAPENYGNARLSPDGRRIAADKTDPNGRNIDLWVGEASRGATTRLTFDPALDQTPIWSPDGKQILFASSRDLGFHLYIKNSDGSGAEEKVARVGLGMQINVFDWSRDGKNILFAKDNELWSLSWPDRIAKPLLQAKWTVKNAQFSPDGRWIAYASNETGNLEIYVSPFPAGAGKWQVSGAGGEEPRWRKDGKELFYLSPEGRMMAVAVKTGASFEAGAPVTLFQAHRRQTHSSGAVFSYDVTGDGERFVIITKADEPAAAPLSVVLNWAAEMEK